MNMGRVIVWFYILLVSSTKTSFCFLTGSQLMCYIFIGVEHKPGQLPNTRFKISLTLLIDADDLAI